MRQPGSPQDLATTVSTDGKGGVDTWRIPNEEPGLSKTSGVEMIPNRW
jgi:hypothetical protein